MAVPMNTRAKRVESLINDLKYETLNMVPLRHYNALVNCLEETMRVMEKLRDAVPENRKNKDVLLAASAVLNSINGMLNDKMIGTVKDINGGGVIS